MPSRPEPTEAVRVAIDAAINKHGAELTPETRLLWLHKKLAMDGREISDLVEEWSQAAFTTGGLAKDRAEQNSRFVGTLRGKQYGNRTGAAVRERFTSVEGKDYSRLKHELTDDTAAQRYFQEFEAWVNGAASGPSAAGPSAVGGVEVDDLVGLLQRRKNVVLEGVPGTGKTHVVGRVASRWQAVTQRRLRSVAVPQSASTSTAPLFATMVMHPSTTYEDFVEGIRPVVEAAPATSSDASVPDGAGGSAATFGVVAGFFRHVCREAASHPEEDVLVLLDELNRCNVSSVLGDLVMLLEPSKRAVRRGGAWAASHEVLLPYSGQRFAVPANVHVIATTNTTDRSVAPLDAAIRRRFAFVRLEPDFDRCLDLMQAVVDDGAVGDTIEQLVALNADVLGTCLGPDALLGQSYVFSLVEALEPAADRAAGASEVRRVTAAVWRYDVLPQLVDTLRSLGAEDLLSTTRCRDWLADRPEIGKDVADRAVLTLAALREHLTTLGIVVDVVGTGLSRSVRIGAATGSDVGVAPPSPGLE